MKSEMIFDKETGLHADMEYRWCSFVHASVNMMEDWCGISDIGLDTMSDIIGKNFDDEIRNVLYDPNSSNMDTCVREDVMDCVAQYFLGEYWPCYGNKRAGDFETDLKLAIQKKNESE